MTDTDTSIAQDGGSRVDSPLVRAQAFDPARYLTKLSRRQKTADGQWKTVELDYMEVKWRLLWLRTEHPDAHIDTELHTLDLDRQFALFKATVSIPDRGSATGWGSETAEDWRDFVEKSETKAIGRALAALGFGTQFTEDHAFDPTAEKVVDAPVQRPTQAAPSRAGGAPASSAATPRAASAPAQSGTPTAAASGGSWTDRPATEPQIKAIYAVARGARDMVDMEIEEWCRQRYGCAPSDLNRRQASEAIDALKLGASS